MNRQQIRLRALELAVSQEDRVFTGEPMSLAQLFVDWVAALPDDNQDAQSDLEEVKALAGQTDLSPISSAIFQVFPDIDKSARSWLMARLVGGVVECRKLQEIRRAS